jgi:hypothetical protein
MTPAEQAKATLVHYFEQLTLRCGMMWRPEQIQEVESIVDNILRSMDGRLNPAPDCYPHVWATTDGGAEICVKCGSRRGRAVNEDAVKSADQGLPPEMIHHLTLASIRAENKLIQSQRDEAQAGRSQLSAEKERADQLLITAVNSIEQLGDRQLIHFSELLSEIKRYLAE